MEKIDYAGYLADYDDEGGDDRIANVDELISKAVAEALPRLMISSVCSRAW